MKNKTMILISSKSNQQGYTLVELMIAGVLGLILLLGVMQVYLGSTRSNRVQEGIIEVQDNGRFIISYMEKDLQRAGWTNLDSPLSNTVSYIDFATSANGASGASDSITIEYQAEDEDGIDTEFDCDGTAIARGNTITNRYAVVANVLECNGRELIKNVDSFQVLYGVESNVEDMDSIVDAYIHAGQIAGYEDNVITVRLAVLLSTSNNVLGQPNNNSYQVLDETFAAAGDSKLRRLLIRTIMLPNHPIY